ncbi:MAG: hypothetical protein JNL01_06360 [Bdellovibrionales bacterium]|nr:hypothetical protein [Bdellovibrionales bacterium]
MKKIILVVSLAMAVSASAFAAKKEKKAETTESAATTFKSSSASGPTDIGLGFSTMDSQNSGTGRAVSALFELNDKSAIQVLFAIHGVSPFTFTAGGIYKMNITGNRNTGVHVGGGLSLGTISAGNNIGGAINAAISGANVGSGTSFGVNILPNAGFHFTVPGMDKILFSFDTGLVLAIIGGSVDFGITPYSNLGGLSIHYML